MQNATELGVLVSWKRVGVLMLWSVVVGWLGAGPLQAQVGQQSPGMGIPESGSLVGDTSGLAREAQGWLVDLIKINTTNPPGNEQAAAKYIAAILTKEGVAPELLDVAPGRSAVVARLRSAVVADPSRASVPRA